jgi:hypothetical protein
MKGRKPSFPRKGLARRHYNTVGRHIVGALFNAGSAQKASGHIGIHTGIQAHVAGKDRLGQGHLAPRNCRLSPEFRKYRAMGAANPAFHAFPNFFFYRLKKIHWFLGRKSFPTTDYRLPTTDN